MRQSICELTFPHLAHSKPNLLWQFPHCKCYKLEFRSSLYFLRLFWPKTHTITQPLLNAVYIWIVIVCKRFVFRGFHPLYLFASCRPLPSQSLSIIALLLCVRYIPTFRNKRLSLYFEIYYIIFNYLIPKYNSHTCSHIHEGMKICFLL